MKMIGNLFNLFKFNQYIRKDTTWDEKCNLGSEQSAWLKKEIEESTAEYTIIAAGVQILSDDRPCEHFYPKTKDFLLKITNPKSKMFYLSGDVHHAELLVDECSKHIHGYKLREFISSGLTHGLGTVKKFGIFVGHLVKDIVGLLFPYTFTEFMDEARFMSSRYYGNNYGLIEIYEN
jgi:hypothetical protein